MGKKNSITEKASFQRHDDAWLGQSLNWTTEKISLKIPTRLPDLAPAYLQPQDLRMGSFLCLDCSTPRLAMFGSFSTLMSYFKMSPPQKYHPWVTSSKIAVQSHSHYVYLSRYTLFSFVYLFIVCICHWRGSGDQGYLGLLHSFASLHLNQCLIQTRSSTKNCWKKMGGGPIPQLMHLQTGVS